MSPTRVRNHRRIPRSCHGLPIAARAARLIGGRRQVGPWPSDVRLPSFFLAAAVPAADRLKALVPAAFTPEHAFDHADRIGEIIHLVYDRALERPP